MATHSMSAAVAAELHKTAAEYLARYRLHLMQATQQGRSGVVAAAAYARAVDGLLSTLFCAAAAAVQRYQGIAGHQGIAGPALGPRFPLSKGLTLVAQGSHGRGVLGLSSDIDMLFLAEDSEDAATVEVVEAVLHPLWDLGLDLGHALRRADETLTLAADDVATRTALLDLRWVAGDRQPLVQLQHEAQRRFFADGAADFVRTMQEQTVTRHERFGGSLYLLEPEIKLGRGGLRDLDVLGWIAKAHWGCESVEALVQQGVLVEREAQGVAAARDMLWRIRHLLHGRAKRRQDRLTFEDQEDCARQLGFVDGITLGVEQFMQAYYRHANVIAQTTEQVMERALRSTSKSTVWEALPEGIALQDGQWLWADLELLRAEPCTALRLYRQVAQRQKPPAIETRQAIQRLAAENEWRQRLQQHPQAASLFLWLLTYLGEAPVRRGSILGELHEVGLMVAMIPEFEPLLGRVQHDIYHVYTVDVHSVAAIDRLRAVMRGDLATEWPLSSRLGAESSRRVPLFVGLLLHDIGKARGKNHSVSGAEIAGPVCARLQLSSLDTEHVVWLVREHLSLYHWATRRDIHDPETIAEAGRAMGTIDRLRDLHLLTVADLSTTNPQAMTAWKSQMLDDLYLAIAAQLEGDAEHHAVGRAERLRQQVSERLQEIVPNEVERTLAMRFVEAMPDRYVLANVVDAMLLHAQMASRHGAVSVRVRRVVDHDLMELVVMEADRPGLLADITAVLAAEGLAIVTAQIYSFAARDGESLACDVFWLRRPQGDAAIDAAVAEKIGDQLAAMRAGKLSSGTLLQRRRRPPAWSLRKSPDVATEVHVDANASALYTVVDVYTRDQVGLLHVIARTLRECGLSIALAKVNTEGERVADVFYVARANAGPITEPAEQKRLQAALIAAIDALQRQAMEG